MIDRVRWLLGFVSVKRANQKAVSNDRITDLWCSDDAPVFHECHFLPNIVFRERLDALPSIVWQFGICALSMSTSATRLIREASS